MIANAKIVGVGVNPSAYHSQDAKRGTADFIMSSSGVREFAQCPSRWKAGYCSPDSDAKDFGSLLDTKFLTPNQFAARYAIKPASYVNEDGETKPWNGNSKVCKQWLADNSKVEVVTNDAVFGAEAAIKRLREDEIICAFVDASDKQVHIKAEWRDETTGLVIPIQALLDLVPRSDTEFCKCAGDLKTTRNGAAMAWQRWCYQAGYHIQAGFFIDMLCAAEGGSDRNTFCFILSENYPPWEPGKRMLGQEFLDIGRKEYARMLANYCACLKSGKWPGYDDHDEAVQSWTVVSAELWMQERAMFAPKYDFGEEPVSEIEEEPQDVPTP